jgi:DNA-damage-inducible protein J
MYFRRGKTPQENSIMANGIVQARIDNAVKEEAAAVLATIGLTVSDAVRLLLMRIAQDKAMPFNPLIPNAKTIAAIEEARAGNLPRVNSIKELFEELNAED